MSIVRQSHSTENARYRSPYTFLEAVKEMIKDIRYRICQLLREHPEFVNYIFFTPLIPPLLRGEIITCSLPLIRGGLGRGLL